MMVRRAYGLMAGAAVALSSILVTACSSTPATRAPIIDLSGSSSAGQAAANGAYVVKPGDTLLKISRANNVDPENIKRWNNLSNPNQLYPGQVLKLSEQGAAPSTAPSTAPEAAVRPQPEPLTLTSNNGAAASTPSSGSEPTPLEAPAQQGAATTPAADAPPALFTPATPATPASSSARASDANLVDWGWPAQGPVTQTFTAASKGVNIAGKLGDPVLAAADGLVKYSGNGIRGLGNLVIIEHANGFISAYAHNQTVLVKPEQRVKRGQKIAELGQSDITTPMLHFEIRRRGTPVDPQQYLPAR